MVYITTTNDQLHTVDIGENGQQHGIILNGTVHTIDWRHLASLVADAKGNRSSGGHYSLIVAGKSYDIFARRMTKPDEKESQTYEVHITGQRFEVKVEDERTKKLAGLVRSGVHSGEASVQAPMPGLVINVSLEAGASVEEGQTVVVLEAMKMENDLASPIAGKLKEVRVSKGQTVEQGQVLVIIENASA